MERFKHILVFCIIFSLVGCKKKSEVIDPTITVENLLLEFITSDRVDISYELSNLGYQETGVTFYKITAPQKTTEVRAIRENEKLKLSLQGLESNTEYAFRVFIRQNNQQKTDSRDYSVKTLTAERAKFSLTVRNTVIDYDENGHFTAEIEGENLNDLKLSQLDIRVDNTPLKLDYPVLISGNRYKIAISGTIYPSNGMHTFTGQYQEQEILFQSVPFLSIGEHYWLTYNPTKIRAYNTSVFNNEFYHFTDKSVLKWNDSDQRWQTVGKGNTRDGLVVGSEIGTEFNGAIFFYANEKELNSSTGSYIPEAYSYSPDEDLWMTYSFTSRRFFKSSRSLGSSHSFIHKEELYLAFGIFDYPAIKQPGEPANYIYRYNKSTKQFSEVARLKKEIKDYQFVSINNQLFLIGLVPVFDQGFKLSPTLCVYKINDRTFEMEEIYRGGTNYEPLILPVKQVLEYKGMALIAASLSEFYLFDPTDKQLHPVYLKNWISNMYYGGFFHYKNKLHLKADILSTSEITYEISITKGRQ